MKIRKRNGSTEKFDKQKLRSSMVNASAQPNNTSKIAELIANRMREGMQTVEIKRQATLQLRGLDPTAADQYDAFKPEISAE